MKNEKLLKIFKIFGITRKISLTISRVVVVVVKKFNEILDDFHFRRNPTTNLSQRFFFGKVTFLDV